MNVSSAAILEDLNPPQREAVETLSGPLLILAGAGSGKTRVVTRRVANLIAHGVRPWEILAITFTNKSAGEMRRRVEDLTGGPGVWLSTFHSFCARVLRREAQVLGYSPNFSIYDEDDATKVLKEVTGQMRLDDKRYSARSLRATISHLKSQALGPGDLNDSSFHERIIQEVYRGYAGTLAKNQALDFDDLLLQTVRLLSEHEDVRQRYRERFRHVLVDEYQDTNGCQYQLVKLLTLGHRNVCATGDPDQSIYSWRGADVRNILSFEKDFPEAKVVRLEQNYRSTSRILALASAVIRHNTERKEKELWTQNQEGEKIALTVVGDEELEAYEVAAEITRRAQSGRAYNDFAIFYRTNAQSRPFETALIQSSIPYQLIGGTPFYERREIKDALAYLRLLVNPKDDISFARILNVPKRGLGASTLDQVAKQAAALHCSMLEALDQPAWMERDLRPKARQELFRFARMLDALRAGPGFPVADALLQVLKATGLREALEEGAEPERLENLAQLVNAAAAYDDEHRPAPAPPAGAPPEPGAFDGLEELAQRQGSLAGFLENAALVSPTDALKEDADRVSVMTLHMAKGLEFPFVFIAGLEEGLLPMLRTGGGPMGLQDQAPEAEQRALEEERRLFYVGTTRARERLYLLRTQHRMRFGKTELAIPSRFLDEVPEKLLDSVDRSQPAWAGAPAFAPGGTRRPAAADFQAFERELDAIASSSRPGPRPPAARSPGQAQEAEEEWVLDASGSQLEESAFEIGDRVRHELFGEGTVEDLRGSGLSAKVRVHFRKVGPKLLLLSLAKLRKC